MFVLREKGRLTGELREYLMQSVSKQEQCVAIVVLSFSHFRNRSLAFQTARSQEDYFEKFGDEVIWLKFPIFAEPC